MKKIFIFLMSVFISGCVTMEQVDKRMSAWNSVSLSDLINAWGVPTKEQSIAGRQYYVWNAKSLSSTPTIGISAGSLGGHGGISVSTLFGVGLEENFCSRVVEVGPEEKIISIQWSGKAKLCYELTPERLVTRTP